MDWNDATVQFEGNLKKLAALDKISKTLEDGKSNPIYNWKKNQLESLAIGIKKFKGEWANTERALEIVENLESRKKRIVETFITLKKK